MILVQAVDRGIDNIFLLCLIALSPRLQVFIALEMAGHGDLLDYVKLRGAIPEDRARQMFTQLVDAIQYLHDLNIIHR